MSLELGSKLSTSIELTRWVASILTAMTSQAVSNIAASEDALFLTATSLACLLGAFASYKVMRVVFSSKQTAKSGSKDITSETTKIDPSPIVTSESIDTTDDSAPLLAAESMESVDEDDEIQEEIDPMEEYHESIESDEELENEPQEDETDTVECLEESKPVRRATRSKVATSEKESVSETKKPVKSKKETLSQMRKRVAREMKEAEERRKQRAAPNNAAAQTKSVRKETVSEMKARVAREFAAKLK